MRKCTIFLMVLAFMLSSSVIWAQQITSGSSDLKVNNSAERSSRDLLYDQIGTIAGGYASQDFEAAYNGYDCVVADDFIVPAGETWAITSVTAGGNEWTGPGGFSMANIYFYNDNGGVPADVAFESFLDVTVTDPMTGIFDVDLPTAAILTPGTYWIGIQAKGDYALYGQFGITNNSSPVVGTEMYWITGPDFGYTTWTSSTVVWGTPTDMAFALNGTAEPASIAGYALNGGGQTIAGVTIEETTSGRTTLTGATGYYEFYNIPDGTWTLTATKDGYNPATASVTTVTGTTVTQNFTLTAPNITISPLIFDETLHPNEYLTTYLSLLNTGDGPLNWTAFVVYPATSISDPAPPVFDPNFVPAVETAETGGTINVVPSETKSLASNRALLFDNGPLVNSPGTGSGGADESILQSVSLGMNTIGFGFQQNLGNHMADDFEVLSPWTVESFTFYGYQTNSPTTSTITGAYFQIYDGNPSSGGVVIYGNMVTNMMTSTQWSGIYRVTETTGGATSRPIMEVVCQVPDWTLDPGTYWVEVALTGSLSSGPWCPPVTINGLTTTGNAQQSLSGVWGPANDTGTGTTQDIPFLIEGSGGGGVGGWLTLDDYVGIVAPGGGSFNIGTNFDAAGTVAGEVYHADIEVYTNPNVGSIVIPVTMTIAGDPFPIIDDFTAELTDPVTGEVTLSWGALREVTIEYYLIYRDGVLLTTVTTNGYVDMLPGFGVYEYELQPIFLEGDGSMVGPVEVEWFEPALCWDPNHPENTQWAETQQEVMLELENCNNGVLEFTFPDYAARALLSDPNVKKNDVSIIEDHMRMGEIGKDEVDPRDGNGHPVILGAGGPDDYGYVWIDSDEAGGPIFSWIDITGDYDGVVAGTLIGDDNWYGPISLGWDFPIYDHAQDFYYIESNGAISFNASPLDLSLSNSQIPTNNTSRTNFVAWFWDDLDPANAACNVYYKNFGNYYVITFDHYLEYPDSADDWVDAQMILYPSGKVIIQYNYIHPDMDILSNTIGIQGASSQGLQVSYNTSYLHDGLAIMISLPTHFIVDVQPYYGLIGEGLTADITMTYSSEGFEEGSYDEDLFITTNEMPVNEWFIPNTMHVVEPEMISGQVTDCNTGQPLENVTVTATVDTRDLDNEFSTSTDELGMYMLYVNPGEDYYVMASMVGYQSASTTVDAGDLPAEDVDFELCEEPYPVDWVIADPNEEDTECMVTWSLPMGPYLIAYDDGTAEDYFSWVGAGGMSAVKFTPAGYPATVEGAEMYVGMGTGPVEFVVLDDDGPGGMPGTKLDSLTVTAEMGWVGVDGFDVTFEDGDFYIAYRQLLAAPAAAPVGVDLSVPTVYRSYVKAASGDWMASAYNDFMIRAIVSGPGENVMAAAAEQMIYPGKLLPELYVTSTAPNGVPGLQGQGQYLPVVVENADRDLATYQLYRVSDIDPDGGIFPESGTHTLIEPALTSQMYNDTDWEDLDPGFYAYGVTATYDNDDVSDITYSNIVAHLLDNTVTLNITQCDGLSPEGADVELTGQNYPFQVLTATTDATGIVVFDSVIDGTYDLVITKTGYIDYIHNNIWIYDDYEEDVVLQEVMMPARNLVVDPLTSWASWDSPYFVYMPLEGFEGADFPPAGWTSESNGTGWFQTSNGSSTFFNIPPGDGMYACVNDDASDYDGCCDYLILPEMDLTEAVGFMLEFDAYYTGAFSHLATVEYSLNGGTSWTVAYNLPGVTSWTTYQIEMDMLAGESSVLVAFHADDQGFWASGMAVDNVMSYYGKEPVGYYVYLDGGYVGATAGDVTTYQYQNLTYGQTYEAAVRALYSCGVSDPIFYTFTSSYLYPPRNLMDEYVYGTNEIPVMWNPPMTVAGPAMDRSMIIKSTAPGVHAESNAGGTASTTTSDRDLWDIQYSFDIDGPSGLTGLAGAECDGEFIYATKWAGSEIVKFDVDGNFIETFSIPGVSGLRDLAYDGTYMYGAAASTTVYKMDFTAQTLVSSFTAPTAVRAIAYDNDAGGFWGNNWDTDLVLFDESGATLDVISGPPSMYGAAYDNFTAGGPYLWVFTGTTTGGGCQIEQMEIATGNLTGVSQSVSGDFGDYIAGGLYITEDLVSGTRTLGGTAQGTPDLAFGYEIGTYSGGGGGTVPGGLLSFNLYRDDAMIANVPYEGQGTEEWVLYVDNMLMPDCYVYDVTAVYDLTDFGFPGEIGESAKEGPHEVCIVWGLDLPFCEDFSQGYDFNGWMVNDANWTINSQVGNAAPSAQWNWDPDPGTPYMSTLTSPPMNADMLTEGRIWLDFDLSLNNRNATGEEMMKVEVYNGNSWHTVATFDNEGGSFAFTENHIEITNDAIDGVFMVRFNATGANSFDVIAWNVDNVCLYRTCDAPFNLTGEYVWNAADEFGAEVCWEVEEAGSITTEWLSYNDGTFENGFCSTDGGAGLAQLFTPTEYPLTITEVRYWNDSYGSPGQENHVYVLTGDGATVLAGPYSVTGEAGDTWVTVDVDDVTITSGTFMVYTENQVPNGPFVGVDESYYDGTLYFGSVGAFTELGEYGYYYVGSHEAYVTFESAAGSVQNSTLLSPSSGTSRMELAVSNHISDPELSIQRPGTRELDHFNVYRSMEGAEDYTMVGTVAAEEGVLEYCYFDQEAGIGNYCYKVTAVYMSEEDECESDYAMDVAEEYDYVCVFITDVEDPTALTTNLYPNPARDNVTITSSADMSRIRVINYVGQLVADMEVNQQQVTLNTTNFESGIYVVRIEAGDEVITKRFAIAR